MNLTRECAQQSMLTNEDEEDYCNAWEERTELTKELPSCLMPEFKYRTAEELDGFLIMADLDSYSGGGYMVKVKGQSKEIRGNLVKLQQQRWINNQTRAVILEFATYNVNINVFVVITITAEFLPGEDDVAIIPFIIFVVIRRRHPTPLETGSDQTAHTVYLGRHCCLCSHDSLLHIRYLLYTSGDRRDISERMGLLAILLVLDRVVHHRDSSFRRRLLLLQNFCHKQAA